MSNSKNYTVSEITTVVQGRSKANNLIGADNAAYGDDGTWVGPTKVVDPRFLKFSLNNADPVDSGVAFDRGEIVGMAYNQDSVNDHGLIRLNRDRGVNPAGSADRKITLLGPVVEVTSAYIVVQVSGLYTPINDAGDVVVPANMGSGSGLTGEGRSVYVSTASTDDGANLTYTTPFDDKQAYILGTDVGDNRILLSPSSSLGAELQVLSQLALQLVTAATPSSSVSKGYLYNTRTYEMHLGHDKVHVGWFLGASTGAGTSEIKFYKNLKLSTHTNADHTTAATDYIIMDGANFRLYFDGAHKLTVSNTGALSTTTSITSPVISGSTSITTPKILTPAGGTLDIDDISSSGTVTFSGVQTEFYGSAYMQNLQIVSDISDNSLVPVEFEGPSSALLVKSKNGYMFKLDAFSDFPNSPMAANFHVQSPQTSGNYDHLVVTNLVDGVRGTAYFLSAGYGLHTGPDFTKYAKFGQGNADNLYDYVITNYSESNSIYFKNGKMTSEQLEVSGAAYVYGSLRGALSGSTNTLELAGIVNNVGDPAGNARLLTKQVAFEATTDKDRGLFWFKSGTTPTSWSNFDMDTAGTSTGNDNTDPYCAITSDSGHLNLYARANLNVYIDYNDAADGSSNNNYFSIYARRPSDVSVHSLPRKVLRVSELGEIFGGFDGGTSDTTGSTEDFTVFLGPQRDGSGGTGNLKHAGFCNFVVRNFPNAYALVQKNTGETRIGSGGSADIVISSQGGVEIEAANNEDVTILSGDDLILTSGQGGDLILRGDNSTKFYAADGGWDEVGRFDSGGYLSVYGGTAMNYPSGAGGGRFIVGASVSTTTSSGNRLALDQDMIAAHSGNNGAILYIQNAATGYAWSTLIGQKTNNAGYVLTVMSNGTCAAAAFSTTSDERMKKEIEDITYGLDEINQLRPVSFIWKDEESASNDRQLGLIAQEVIEVIPEGLVFELEKPPTNEQRVELQAAMEAGKEPEPTDLYYSMNYAAMAPVLVKAIQELSAKVDSLQAELDELKEE